MTISKDSPLRDSLSLTRCHCRHSRCFSVFEVRTPVRFGMQKLYQGRREDKEDGDVDADEPKQNVNILFVNKSCEQDETCHVLAVKNKKHVFITSDSALELLLLARLLFGGRFSTKFRRAFFLLEFRNAVRRIIIFWCCCWLLLLCAINQPL